MFGELIGKQLLFFDGAMGTELQAAGLKAGEIPELWNIKRADAVRDVHARYLAAGCDIIKTNTFGCNADKLQNTGHTVEDVVAHAIANIRRAIEQCGKSKPRYIALDIGPTGKLLKPLGDLHFNEAYALFAETIAAGKKAGADLVLIETMSDAYELKAAVLAAKENCELPVIASVTLDEKGKMLTGGGVDVAVALLEGLGVNAIGFNCGLGPGQLTPHIAEALSLSSRPILLMPNAGLPESIDGVTSYNVGPEEFARLMRLNAESGVWLLGGCCGTTPAHLEELVKNCAGIVPPPLKQKNLSVASSYTKTVVFGPKPLIIGERINPTGKPRLKQAIKDENYDYIQQEGILQVEQGADLLDVNAGMPGIDEAAVLTVFVEQLQSVIDTPLQLDSADVSALAKAMRIYNGKPVINSVNGKAESMAAVFPLLKKYGGLAVALTLDEGGIPETAQGRVDIAEKILKNAENYGIGREAFLFDPLTMAVSAGQDNARVTVECVSRLKELGLKTLLGVSNVSFGLPSRDILNAAFLRLALDSGLDAAIFNPGESAMHQAIADHLSRKDLPLDAAMDALLGKDEKFQRYINTYGTAVGDTHGGQQGDKINDAEAMSLGEAVFKGLKKQAVYSAQLCLERQAPLEIIEQELIPALNRAGEYFEQGKMYLPQLLMCAEATKEAFTHIRAAMGSVANDTIGTIVIATVEGDIHDIGKNIVRAMLENYRFHVVDLGKDVPVQSVVEAVKKHKAKLAGLSALMTTTVASMEKTILALRDSAPDCKIMCGGAVLTKDYAESIGADFYAKDAMASVRYAQKIFDNTDKS
ncbi:MAG: homocysteine S-methyltransferase family protein [Treponema sp.]|nr:homocysteine S-methyltransferase family protein [Treponema sp.]